MSRKLERYGRIRDQLAGLLADVTDPTARRATAAALLHHKVPDVSWTGFYMRRGEDLVVDVYQGPLACIVLTRGKGVCWAAVTRGEAVIVPDVSTFPGHIPCDDRTRSEIVVPHLGSDGGVIGVLDLDSHRSANFDDEDRIGLSSVLRLLEGSRTER